MYNLCTDLIKIDTSEDVDDEKTPKSRLYARARGKMRKGLLVLLYDGRMGERMLPHQGRNSEEG